MSERSGEEEFVARLIGRLPLRLRVFVPGVVGLGLAAAGLCLLVLSKTLEFSPQIFTLWGHIMAGPFVVLWVPPDQEGWPTLGLVNLAFILAHPIRPGRWTAGISGVAFLSWLFWGAAVAFRDV